MKSLFFICHLLVLFGMAVSLIREYIYVSQSVNWTTAQNYCKQHYGDLVSITTIEEYQNAVQVLNDNTFLAWIGLKTTGPNLNNWQWSDGEKINFTKWALGEPNNMNLEENCAVMNQKGWFDFGCWERFSSICYRRFILVKENKTWEEAVKYCKNHYTNLAFVDSKTLLDLLKIETEQAQTASVWTGLRFLDGKWFWVNGASLGSLVSLPSCPVQPYRCGAFNFNTYVWEDRDCNEELNFLCYHRG